MQTQTPRPNTSKTDSATDYALAVASGSVIAGPLVRAAAQRHLDDLKHGHTRGLIWDVDQANRAIDFFADVLTVEDKMSDDESSAIPFILAPWQCFVVGSLFGWFNKDGFRRFRRAYIEAAKGSGKALALDTPVPTPHGWKNMGDLVVGDQVFDQDGYPCKVIAAHDVHHGKTCYRLSFADGGSIVADMDHLWVVTNRSRTNPRQFITGSLARHDHAARPLFIPMHCGLRTPEIQLPINPEELAERLLSQGGPIPDVYFRASIEQRMTLLRGFMDRAARSLDTMVVRTIDLAKSIINFLLTLGIRAEIVTETSGGHDFKILLIDLPGFNPFWTSERARDWMSPEERGFVKPARAILACDECESVPVRCITVDSPSGLFLAGAGMIATHNSPLAAGIGHYMLTAQKKLRAEVYAAAAQKSQAMIIFEDCVAMYRRSKMLMARLTPSGLNPTYQLTDTKRQSFFKPLSSENKGKSGIRPYCALIDEIHEHPDNTVIEMLRAGTKGNKQALIFEITNSGFDRMSVCYQEHEYTAKVLTGEKQNDSWFGMIFNLDKDDDPFEDETCWIKSNPTLGVTIDYDYIREQVNEAKGMPSKESHVRRLHFCEWTDADQTWISRNVWIARERPLLLEDFTGQPCYGALDLSFTKDLTAMGLTFPIDDNRLACFVEFWTPRATAAQRSQRDRVSYVQWIKEGHLHAPEGPVIKLASVGARLGEIQDLFDLKTMAYDKYRHRELEEQLSDLGIDIPMTEHPQGFRRSPDSNLWMPTSVDELENAIIEGRIDICTNPVLRWNAASVVIRSDPAGTGNKIFDKRKATGRIDGVVCMAMSVGAAMAREFGDRPIEIGDDYRMIA